MEGGRGALPAQRSRSVRNGGALGSENAGMSSVRNVSKRSHRMAEVSAARFILGGLVGPKPRPKGVGDGQTVDIPLPLRTIQSQVGAGWVRSSVALEMLRLSVQVRDPSGFRAEAWERFTPIRLTLASKKSRSGDAVSARTANRHWWPGVRAPRWTSDPSLRN